MKIDRQALIFGAIVMAVILAVVLMSWFANLLRTPAGAETSPIQDFFSALFPFGDTNIPDETGSAAEENALEGPVPQLRKVSEGPIAGFRFQSDGTLRYLERETGHFFETETDAFSKVRISNTTVPAVQEVVWISDEEFIMRYIDENGFVQHFHSRLASSTQDQALSGDFLAQRIQNVVPIPENEEVLFVVSRTSGVAVERGLLDENGGDLAFTSALQSWRLLPTALDILIQTAPSSVTGFLYRIKSDQTLEKVLEGPGLMALPRQDGKYIAYSGLVRSGLGLFVLDMETGTAYQSPTATFAEKCSWFKSSPPYLFCGVPNAGTPIENWYIGLTSTNDVAWIIDPVFESATVVMNLADNAGREIDVWKPEVSPDGKYAAFLNKSDLSLWLLRFEP